MSTIDFKENDIPWPITRSEAEGLRVKSCYRQKSSMSIRAELPALLLAELQEDQTLLCEENELLYKSEKYERFQNTGVERI